MTGRDRGVTVHVRPTGGADEDWLLEPVLTARQKTVADDELVPLLVANLAGWQGAVCPYSLDRVTTWMFTSPYRESPVIGAQLRNALLDLIRNGRRKDEYGLRELAESAGRLLDIGGLDAQRLTEAASSAPNDDLRRRLEHIVGERSRADHPEVTTAE